MSETTQNEFRLPRTVIPERYDLTLSPDLRQRTFVGRAVVTVHAHEAVHEVVCNACELDIQRAWVVDSTGTRTDAVEIRHDADMQRVTLVFERMVPAGSARITYEYTGTLNDKLVGFYASTYTDDDGVEHVIAATQCESTDARKVFPGWDEPDLKAVFGITLVVAPNLTAISNESVRSTTTLSSGNKAVTFEDTMVMSTYLVCLVVGELETTEPVMVGNVPIRAVHRKGMAHLTAFGLEIASFSLDYFQRYYDIPYPGRKLDLIALPDFAAGAMENLGAVTFREQLLLIDPAAASHVELERVADVVAHEVAHMWFGDLVTMSWWNGLWLNEAFATFAEIACVAAFRPEWDRWTSFGIFRTEAQIVDALHTTRPIEYPVISPTDAEGMFDLLTYEKGASILRMLEQYLGEERFRDGVRHYLRKHAYGNTETTDLFNALEEVTGEPVEAIMNGWIFTGGFPLVSATIDSASQQAILSQSQFTYLPDGPSEQWSVPVLWRLLGDDAKAASGRALLQPNESVGGIPAGDQTLVVNSGGYGFYRVRYDDELARRLRAQLHELTPIERFGLVSDTWAAALAGQMSVESFLVLVKSLGDERDPNVWAAALGGLGLLDQIADDEARAQLRVFVQRACAPALDSLGWTPGVDESIQTSRLRGMMVSALGILGTHQPTRDECSARLDAALAGELSADLGLAVIRVSARSADVTLWERFNQLRLEATSPQLVIRMLNALGGAEDPALRSRTLAMLMDGSVRTQDSPYILLNMAADRVNGPATWTALQANWAAYTETIPKSAVGRIVSGLAHRTEPGLPEDIAAFFVANPIPQAAKQVQQHLEQLRIHANLRAREGATLSAIITDVLDAA